VPMNKLEGTRIGIKKSSKFACGFLLAGEAPFCTLVQN
jgi:hypothetical protein